MKLWTVALLAPLLCAADPAPLLVGVVHDQFGQPIAGAQVRFYSRRFFGFPTATDAAGTFALQVPMGEGNVVISCAYCATASVHVQNGEPVIAVVQRFSAVADDTPNARDLRALQYSTAAGALSLRPYAVLNDSSTPYPGPHLSQYGISPIWGGLVVDDGIPNYDVAFIESTLPFLPASALQNAQVLDSAQGFRYGTTAGAGTFLLDTRADPGTSAQIVGGSERSALIAQDRYGVASSISASATSLDSRDRVDVLARAPVGDDTLQATAIAAASRQYDADQSLDSAFDAAKVSFEHSAALGVHADLIADTSGYSGELYPGAGVSSGWNDVQADAGIQTSGPGSFFFDASLRQSNGFYADPTQPGIVAGNVTQSRLDTGATMHSSVFSGTAGLAAYWIASNGGTGTPQKLSTHLLDPSVDFTYSPSPQWSASLSSTEYFRIPSLLELYSPPSAATLQLVQAPVVVEKIAYGDLHRLRFEALNVNGQTRANGESLAWEVAPNVSLRAWGLAFSNTLEGVAAVTSSLWATYDNPAGLRIDAIERRDLIDTAENQHFDAAISAPVASHLRLYAGSERRRFTRLYRAGLQFTP